MKKYTEQEVEQFLREQRKICADRAVIDYAEPDKLMMLIQAPEPASFISSKQDVIKSVCGCWIPDMLKVDENGICEGCGRKRE